MDEAVALFGNYVTGELNSIEGKDRESIERAQQHLLQKLLADSPDEVKQAYSDPAMLFNES